MEVKIVIVVVLIAINGVCGLKIGNNMFRTRSITPVSSGFASNLVESISHGAQIGIDQCQKVFKWSKWNCPDSTFSRKFHHPSTKELAFARAIVAAGIVHTITRNCSKGEIKGCGCHGLLEDKLPLQSGRDVDPNEIKETNLKQHDKVDWSWGGCSDDIEYGDQVAKVFLDEMEADDEPLSLVHTHNNLVGRQLVKQMMVKRCRCHGVSGSCTVQTCWMQAAPFETITAALKAKYYKANHIELEMDISNSAMETNLTQHIPTKISTNDIIFLEQSVDYCKPNNVTGWKGTLGRTCSRTKSKNVSLEERTSCKNICRACGHKVKKQKKIVKSTCNCTFKWCCEVKCDTCIKTVDEFNCK